MAKIRSKKALERDRLIAAGKGKEAPRRTGNPIYDKMMEDQEKQDALMVRNMRGFTNRR